MTRRIPLPVRSNSTQFGNSLPQCRFFCFVLSTGKVRPLRAAAIKISNSNEISFIPVHGSKVQKDKSARPPFLSAPFLSLSVCCSVMFLIISMLFSAEKKKSVNWCTAFNPSSKHYFASTTEWMLFSYGNTISFFRIYIFRSLHFSQKHEQLFEPIHHK